MERAKFEYHVVKAYSERAMEAELELHGDQGWELAYAYQAGDTGLLGMNPAAQVIIFKRERLASEEPPQSPPS